MAILSFKAEQNRQIRTTTITIKTLQNSLYAQYTLFRNLDKNIKVKGNFLGISERNQQLRTTAPQPSQLRLFKTPYAQCAMRIVGKFGQE